ncbi:site-specific DNA-methyltransferase [Neisseria montereyensis]|uniref:Site-specific DNA-methyltransferase n=1 Tax=Neisseria montereyensis TaxID=2973938 RepID=A0ABT2FCT7_9NEIS|nr:site-specific DNA-methyltransferase [Neisseria montereyensis]MCS4534039.1 site-specific DNA-methyltransferase [Neisseria montereyensis]
MSQQFELIQKLYEIFQIDRPDLDFGIYRILNSRSREIETYLNHTLPDAIKAAFSQRSATSLEQWRHELADAKKSAEALGVAPESTAKVQELNAKIQNAVRGSAADEAAVYNHLLTFFSRYYDSGDFISQRRYKGDTYAIPYNGEEVMLYWANKDQYYTKSGENFSNYRFTLADGRQVFFRLIDADTAKDNRKDNEGKRFFVLAEQHDIEHEDESGNITTETVFPIQETDDGQTLEIRFEYKVAANNSKQADLTAQAIAAILNHTLVQERWGAALSERAPTEKSPNRTLLEKHLSDYTQKNSADYFIHKDLGGFLNQELDFYIKNEVMKLNDIQDAENFSQIESSLHLIQTLRTIAKNIIAFLAQLENFQKKLWLKKKFVTGIHYLITLDYIPEDLLADVLHNSKQQAQWQDLFSVQMPADIDGVQFAQIYPHLVVDTSLYPAEFQARLLSELSESTHNSSDGLDAATDGLLIHSDNFQALNLLQERYREQVKCIYIDPPYNTGNGDFFYKDRYRHSSWLSLMYDRILLAYPLMNNNSALFCQISDIENTNLHKMMVSVFGEDNHRETISVITSSKSGVNAINVKRGERLFKIKEYLQFYSKNPTFRFYPFYTPDNYNMNYKWEIYQKEDGSWMISDLKSQYDDKSLVEYALKNPKHIYSIEKNNNKAGEAVKAIIQKSKGTNDVEVFFDQYGVQKLIYQGGVCVPLAERIVQENGKNSFGLLGSDVWDDIGQASKSEGGISFDNGKKPEKLLKRIIEMTTQKNDLVMDYFTGSGTTACVAQKLGRKWIGIEQGNYFSDVLITRIKKTIFGEKSGISKSIDYQGSGLVKVLSLESYEDTLNNLQLQRRDLLDNLPAAVQNDYLLHYLLDTESRDSLLNTDDFRRPFNYQMNIATSSAGAFSPQTIDLVETFNYLIGLKVSLINDQRYTRGFVMVEGQLPNQQNDEKTLVLWRDCEKIDYEALQKVMDSLSIHPGSRAYDVVYINGDHNIATAWQSEEDGNLQTLKLRPIEPEFLRLMFAAETV